MSKKPKTADDDYIAGVRFNGMPYNVMIQILSNLSEAEILDLHGLSKRIQNNQLRRAATAVIRQRVEARIDLNDIAPYIVRSNINYRLLLIAIIAYENNNGQIFFTNNRRDTYAGDITIMPHSIVFIWCHLTVIIMNSSLYWLYISF